MPEHQQNLFAIEAQRKRAVARKKDSVAEQKKKAVSPNLYAAGVILQDPEKYGGEQSLMVRWANLVIERAEGTNNGQSILGSAAGGSAVVPLGGTDIRVSLAQVAAD